MDNNTLKQAEERRKHRKKLRIYSASAVLAAILVIAFTFSYFMPLAATLENVEQPTENEIEDTVTEGQEEVTLPPEETEQTEDTETAEQTEDPEENPEITENPEETENPDVTEDPEETENPDVTEDPEETENPDVTEDPEETENPDVTEDPEKTENPEGTDDPEKVDAVPEIKPYGAGTEENPYDLVQYLSDTKDHPGNVLITIKDKSGKIVAPVGGTKEEYRQSASIGSFQNAGGYKYVTGGTYVLKADINYGVELSINATRNGIVPGYYTYDLPTKAALHPIAGKSLIKTITVGGKVIGEYSVDSSNRITFKFYEPEEVDTLVYVGLSYTSNVGNAESDYDIDKVGSLEVDRDENGDTEKTYFRFTVGAEIPAYDHTAYSSYFILDQATIQRGIGSTEEYYPMTENDLEITLKKSSGNVTIKNINDIGEDSIDSFAYLVEDNKVFIVSRCNCDPKYCSKGDDCATLIGKADWCKCWTLEEDCTVEIKYNDNRSTDFYREAPGTTYKNKTILSKIQDGVTKDVANAEDWTKVVPKIIEKTGPVYDHDTGDYAYTILINKDKQTIEEGGAPVSDVTISDVPTHGSAIESTVIVYRNGEEEPLVRNDDYIIEMHDEDGGFDIVLMNPSGNSFTVKYDVEYDINEPVQVRNVAKFKLYNVESKTEYTFTYDDVAEMVRASVLIHKIDSYTKDGLDGAVFGVYNYDGTLVDRVHGVKTTTTMEIGGKTVNGCCLFNKVRFNPDTPYYVQEIEAPDGYELNTARYWFYFKMNYEYDPADFRASASVPLPSAIEENAIFNMENLGEIEIEDEPIFYELPMTGGEGTKSFIVLGTLCTLAGVGLILGKKKAEN